MSATATEKTRTGAGATIPAPLELADIRCSDGELSDAGLEAIGAILVDAAVREARDQENGERQ